MSYPTWLPPMFSVSPWTVDTYDALYEIFERDIKKLKPIYRGGVVDIFRDQEDGKEKVFWHITTEFDKDRAERIPDLRRSERIPWVKPMINNSENSEVLSWDNKEKKNKIKTYVWLKAHDFLVVMNKTKSGKLFLITSFYIERGNYKKKLENKYDRRLI